MPVHQICCIMDFDGFAFKGRSNADCVSKKHFLIREIGYVRVDPEFGDFLSRSIRFDLSSYDLDHTNVDWHTINHQTRYITGLPFRPQAGEKVHNYDLVETCIRNVYEMCIQPGRDIVAFKGGDTERDILQELGIPSLDLAHYGCPRYQDLVEAHVVSSQLIDCGYHKGIDKSVQVVHCPRAEVTAFRDWLMLQYPDWIKTTIPGHPCGSTAGSSRPSSSADSCSSASSSSDYI